MHNIANFTHKMGIYPDFKENIHCNAWWNHVYLSTTCLPWRNITLLLHLRLVWEGKTLLYQVFFMHQISKFMSIFHLKHGIAMAIGCIVKPTLRTLAMLQMPPKNLF